MHWGLRLRFNKMHCMLNFKQNIDFSKTIHTFLNGHRYKYNLAGARVVQNLKFSLRN